eukprot:1394605-Amorphochlora_amoeboformis.AAC.2
MWNKAYVPREHILKRRAREGDSDPRPDAAMAFSMTCDKVGLNIGAIERRMMGFENPAWWS